VAGEEKIAHGPDPPPVIIENGLRIEAEIREKHNPGGESDLHGTPV
jgi:hypothetical protein